MRIIIGLVVEEQPKCTSRVVALLQNGIDNTANNGHAGKDYQVDEPTDAALMKPAR